MAKAIEIPVEILEAEVAPVEKAKPVTPTSQGATIPASEVERVEVAVRELAKDPHAPREISVKANLHVHNDYPEVLYKGKETRSVANEEEKAAAAKDGFDAYDHEAFTAVDEPTEKDGVLYRGNDYTVASEQEQAAVAGSKTQPVKVVQPAKGA